MVIEHCRIAGKRVRDGTDLSYRRQAAARQHGRGRPHAGAVARGPERLGYRLAIFPATGFLAAARSLENVYGELKAKRSSTDLGEALYSFAAFNRLIGFERVWEFDRTHAD